MGIPETLSERPLSDPLSDTSPHSTANQIISIQIIRIIELTILWCILIIHTSEFDGISSPEEMF